MNRRNRSIGLSMSRPTAIAGLCAAVASQRQRRFSTACSTGLEQFHHPRPGNGFSRVTVGISSSAATRAVPSDRHRS